MHFSSCFHFILLALLLCTFSHKSSAAVIYGLISGSDQSNVIASINNVTGEFTIIAKQKSDNSAGLFPGISTFDQINHAFYYASDRALNAVDVVHDEELPAAKFLAAGVTGLVWDSVKSQILVAMQSAFSPSYVLYSYPPFTQKGSSKPTVIGNLTKQGISDSMSQTYDPVNRIFYSVFVSSFNPQNATLLLQAFHLDSGETTVTTMEGCLHKVFYMTYDQIQDKIVGITSNYTDTAIFYPFTFQSNGTCTIGPNLAIIEDFTAAAYDQQTATFYIGFVSTTSMGVLTFNSKTNQISTIPVTELVFDIEVGY